MEDNPVLICVLVFLSVFVPYAAGVFFAGAPKVEGKAGRSGLPLFYRVFWRFIAAVADSFGPSFAANHPGTAGEFTKMALMSGWPITAVHVYAARVLAASAGAMITVFGVFILSGNAPAAILFGAIGAIMGWVYPVMVVRSHAHVRQQEIIKTLPFAIDLISSAMRAGLDFSAAVRHYVATGGKGALAVEFGLLLRQIELGKSRMEALEEMATHVQTQEFSAFVGAVAHGTEIGASIIDTLQVQGEDMRRARFNAAEMKAARAPSIMIFPIAVFILPAVFIIIFVPVILRFMAAKGG